MLCIKAKNAIMHQIATLNSKSIRSPQGRQQKLSNAYILDRIFFVLKTGCLLHVPGSSYKTVYHYYNKWSKACVFENSFYDLIQQRVVKNSTLIADTSFIKNVFGRDVLGPNPTDRGRKAIKVSLLTDGICLS